MATTRLISVRRSDDSNGSSVLVYLSPSGNSALDLLLQATDGVDPYLTNLEEKRVLELKAKKNAHNQDQWAAALKSVLLGYVEPNRKPIENLELVAFFGYSGDELCISVRQMISGISQRLGTITLKRKAELKIELFDWASMAITHATDRDSTIILLEKKVADLNATVTSLKNQITDFTILKEEQENINFEKFRNILNNKKLKIREQQRLLATARIDLTSSQPKKGMTNSSERNLDCRSNTRSPYHRQGKLGAEATLQVENEKVIPTPSVNIPKDANIKSYGATPILYGDRQSSTRLISGSASPKAQGSDTFNLLEEETDDEL